MTNRFPDVTPGNVLTEPSNHGVFKVVEDEEVRDPCVPVMDNGHPIFTSRIPPFELSGQPLLNDFGQMRLADPESDDWWMPDLYRAPEVLLKLPWACPVDVWSVGIMVRYEMAPRNGFQCSHVPRDT